MNKTLIIGASGLVGQVVCKILSEKYSYDLLTPNHNQLDVSDKKGVVEFIKNSDVDRVILLAANTDVDGAEKDSGKEARRVNVDGVVHVAEACKRFNKRLIYISTDFIFEGSKENPGPYRTDSKRPNINTKYIGEYGRSKLLGELQVEKIGGDYTIVRICYPFGNKDSQKDFAIRTIKLLEAGYPLFSDQQFTLTYIPDIATALDKLIKTKSKGVFHVSCHPVTSPFEFGKYLAEKVGLDAEVKKGSLKKFMVGRTPKPLLGGLVPSKELVDRNWKDAVDEFVNQLS